MYNAKNHYYSEEEKNNRLVYMTESSRQAFANEYLNI